MDFVRLAQPAFQRLKAYDPGHDLVALRRGSAGRELIELGSNENSYGCSPTVVPAIRAALADVYRYPDPLGGDLKRALAAHWSIEPAQIILGNGSHELLMQIAQVFAGPGCEVVASQFGFAVYAIAAQAAGARFVAAPALPADAAIPRGHDLDAIAAAVGADTRIVYLCNPNNPTGTWFARRELEAFLDGLTHDCLVVVDEAYNEYVDEPDIGTAVALLPRHPRLIVARTFSKAYGLAGLRIGYALAHPDLIAVLERVRESFNVNNLGLAAAEAALGDPLHVKHVRERNALERDWLADELGGRGFPAGPSQTNFLLVDFGADCARIEASLLKQGVVPRPMAGYGLPQHLRITVGRRDENLALLQALDQLRG